MIFKDENLNRELNEKGYVVLPFLNAGELESIKALHQNFKSTSQFFHSTTFLKSVDSKLELNHKGAGIFARQVNSFFLPHKNLGLSFLTKPAGQGGHMPIHQDWTIVDESRFGSYTVWIPLQDVDETNGAITVLDSSHKLHNTLRAPTLPVVINDIEPLIRGQMKTLRMKAGEAFIFNHALVHASHLNTSTSDRIAITYGLVPQQAGLLFYHRRPDGSVDKYEVADDFFLHYDNHGERPTFVQPSEQLSLSFNQLTAAQFYNFLSASKNRKMKPIFKDGNVQAQFDKEGYALVDMLDEAEVKELREFYASLNNNHIPSYGFHVSLDNSDSGFVERVLSKIKATVKQKADTVFDNYKIFTTSFVVKEKNPISIVPPHQDWSFTKESDGFVSATVWVALVDTDMQNGAMGVLLGSNKFFSHTRPSPAPEFKAPMDPHVFAIFPYLKLIPMKAGQALIFDNKTIHASPPNVSDNVRLAVGFGVTQADAPLRHYYLKPGSNNKTILVYDIDDYFFTHYNNGKLLELYKQGKTPDDLKFVGEIENTVTEISADDLVAMIKAEGNTFNVELCEHLAKLFNYNMDGSKKEEPIQQTEHSMQPEPVVQQIESAPATQQVYVSSAAEWVDNRSFFQKYTPLNILREIKQRVLS